MADGADFNLVGFYVTNGDQAEIGSPSIGNNLSVTAADNTNGANGTSVSFSTNVTVTSAPVIDAASVTISPTGLWTMDSAGGFLDGAPGIAIQSGQSIGFQMDATGYSEGFMPLVFDVSASGLQAGINDISTSWRVDGFASASMVAILDISSPWDIVATGLTGSAMDADIDLSGLAVAATGASTSDVVLDSFDVSGSLLTGLTGNAAAIIAGLSVAATGTGEAPTSTSISLVFGVSGTLASENKGIASIDLIGLSAGAVGLVGTTGRASASIVLTADSSGYGAITYYTDISLCEMVVDGVGYEILPDTGFKVIAMNPELGGDSTTEFDSFDFNSFATFNGVAYGAGSSGLYELTGADDDGVPVQARTLMGVTDLGSETQLYVPNIYLTYRTDGDLEIITRTNESIERINAAEWDGSTGIHEKRVTLNPGVKDRQWQFGFRNVDGADFEVAVMRPLPLPAERRI